MSPGRGVGGAGRSSRRQFALHSSALRSFTLWAPGTFHRSRTRVASRSVVLWHCGRDRRYLFLPLYVLSVYSTFVSLLVEHVSCRLSIIVLISSSSVYLHLWLFLNYIFDILYLFTYLVLREHPCKAKISMYLLYYLYHLHLLVLKYYTNA